VPPPSPPRRTWVPPIPKTSPGGGGGWGWSPNFLPGSGKERLGHSPRHHHHPSGSREGGVFLPSDPHSPGFLRALRDALITAQQLVDEGDDGGRSGMRRSRSRGRGASENDRKRSPPPPPPPPPPPSNKTISRPPSPPFKVPFYHVPSANTSSPTIRSSSTPPPYLPVAHVVPPLDAVLPGGKGNHHLNENFSGGRSGGMAQVLAAAANLLASHPGVLERAPAAGGRHTNARSRTRA